MKAQLPKTKEELEKALGKGSNNVLYVRGIQQRLNELNQNEHTAPHENRLLDYVNRADDGQSENALLRYRKD